MKNDELYMHRCLELAKLGAGNVAPNPMVGSVLVYEDRIVGEGYHQQYGQAHAEVNCINSVSKADEHLIPNSTIYVSLEPCAHFGKTPPCADLIIEKKIRKVVVGCRDPFKQVNGKGIEKLQQAGVEVIMDVLLGKCLDINRRFFTFHIERRPYIVLKWAQSGNRKISNSDRSRVLISNEFTNRLVHKWRAEEAGILVGTNTALFDDPSLNTRLWHGKHPVRLIIDMDLRLPSTLKIFNQQQRTIVFNKVKHEEDDNILYYQITEDVSLVDQILNACYLLNIQSVLIEGGALILQTFIEAGVWDEARVIENTSLIINDGLPAPDLISYMHVRSETLMTDTIFYHKPQLRNI